MSELFDTYWVPGCLDVYAKALAGQVADGNRVLDLGCGTGLVTGYAAQRAGPGGKVVGYDPAPDFLAAARTKRYGGASIEWVEGFGETMPFDDSSFDVVLCSQTLQYVTDRTEVFNEVKRVLKPGGMFHASVWSPAKDQPALGFMEDCLAAHFGADQKPIHAWSFGGLTELRRLAESAGLMVNRLEQLKLDCHFDSIQKFVDVQISCAGHTDENGQMAMGIIDLEDERWLGPIDAFSKDAQSALAAYAPDGALVAPYCSDEISAQA